MSAHDRQLIWSQEAENDLFAIWHFGAAHFSLDVADTHLREIQRAATHLTEFPHSGVARDELFAGIRSTVVYPTVVFYRVGGSSIDIVRVVDGRRNLAALFPRDVTKD